MIYMNKLKQADRDRELSEKYKPLFEDGFDEEAKYLKNEKIIQDGLNKLRAEKGLPKEEFILPI